MRHLEAAFDNDAGRPKLEGAEALVGALATVTGAEGIDWVV